MRAPFRPFFSCALLSATILGVALSPSRFARAESWLAPALTGDSAATLPKGRWIVSVTSLQSNLTKRFDGGGGVEPISNLFYRDIRWADVIESDAERSAQLEGLLAARGVRGETSAGTFRGEFRGDLSARVPVVGYGINDRLGIIAALPVFDIRVRSNVAYVASEEAERLVSDFRASGQNAIARDFETSLNRGFEEELSRAGYDYSQARDRQEIGDLRLEIPYLLRPRRGGKAVAIYSTLVLPTGHTADPREFYGISTGQNRVQIGGRAVASRDVARFRFTGTTGLLYPLPGKRAVRVPRDPLDRLSPDIDPDASVSGGFSYSAAVDARYEISRSWALRSGFQHQRRLRDRFSGTLVSADRYDYVAGSASERLESAFLHLEADSIAAFLAGDFPVPARMLAGLSAPISGRNAVADRMLFLQTNFFF